MDLSEFDNPLSVARFLLPKVPFLLSTALYHSLYLSPTSTKWGIKEELIVKLIRQFTEPKQPKPLLRMQRGSLKDPGIKGPVWVSKVTLPAPNESDILHLLCKAIENMEVTGEETYTVPDILPVGAEWIAHRDINDKKAPRLEIPEDQQYQRLMEEVGNDVTVLYMHGGALIMMDPSSHRAPCVQLAKLTKGRCFSVRYRLAPQHPFPAALLDCFVAYLSLIHPPPDSFHSPVPAGKIVLAGDSAGGNLAFALLQLLLQINRTTSDEDPSGPESFSFHSHTVKLPLPLPAGVATNSAWLDITSCLPSVTKNYPLDFLPKPMTAAQRAAFPSDEIWPADPPRGDLVCDTSMLCHPIMSPLAAESWEGSCPIFMGCGEEMLADENKVVARKAANQGVKVILQQFEAMPHCASMVLPWTEMSRIWFRNWAEFCVNVTNQAVGEDRIGARTKGSWFAVKTNKESELDVKRLDVCDLDEVTKRMTEARERRDEGMKGASRTQSRL